MAMLTKEGHRVDIVANGAEAVEAVSTRPYDVVLMDVQMPEMDGIEATAAIRELPDQLSRIPIIALTANAMKGDREKYLAAGMDDYVSKPIDMHDLFEAVARATGIEHVSDGNTDAAAGGPAAPALSDHAAAALGDLSKTIEAIGGDLARDREEKKSRRERKKRRSKHARA